MFCTRVWLHWYCALCKDVGVYSQAGDEDGAGTYRLIQRHTYTHRGDKVCPLGYAEGGLLSGNSSKGSITIQFVDGYTSTKEAQT